VIVVRGLGWVDASGHGSVRLSRKLAGEPSRDAVFSQPFKNFTRMDRVSRVTCCAAGLAIQDAGQSYPILPSSLAGIAGTGEYGCLESDRAYFRDYLRGGRTLGRGNLFIYTLPSSPLAEAAIHFGLGGLLVYIRKPQGRVAAALDAAVSVMDDSVVSLMLAGGATEDSAIYAVIGRDADAGSDPLCSLDEARAILALDLTVAGTVTEFERLRSGRVR